MESHEEERARAQEIAREKEVKAHAVKVAKDIEERHKKTGATGMHKKNNNLLIFILITFNIFLLLS